MSSSKETTPQRVSIVGSISDDNDTTAMSSHQTRPPSPPPAPPPPLPSAIEFEPPLACIRRILKNALPSSTNVGKDASAAFARASGIFIIYLTACANDFARENKRQTITANDVLAAIKVRFGGYLGSRTGFFSIHSSFFHFHHHSNTFLSPSMFVSNLFYILGIRL
jgi:histone H3/H4